MLNPHPLVGCQAVFLAPVDNGVDASAERAGEKGNMGNREHDGAGPGKIVATASRDRSGEKRCRCPFPYTPHRRQSSAAARLWRRCPEGKWLMLRTPWRHCMGKKRKGPMISPQGREGPIVDFAAYPGQFDAAAVAGKPAFVRPDDAVADREILYGELACSFL